MRFAAPLLAAACLLSTPALADSPIPPATSSWAVILGDANGDGAVDILDLDILAGNFGDFNRDGVVDADDYAIWRGNFGAAGSHAAPPALNGFNGAATPGPLDSGASLAWSSVPMRPLFPTPHAYDAWLAPIVDHAGDYNADGVVDGQDFAVWRDTAVAAMDLDRYLCAVGDFNEDGLVGASDYLTWQQNFGASGNINTDSGWASGDFNADGTVDAADYAVWRDSYGTSLPSGHATAGNDGWWSMDRVVDRCFADQNDDRVLNLDDIDTFVANFLAAHPLADADSDGAHDLDDIGAFVDAFLDDCR